MTFARQQQRRDTSAAWASANPVLLDGEIGVDTDADRIKVGDGETAWTALPYTDRAEEVAGYLEEAQLAAAAAATYRDQASAIVGLPSEDAAVAALVADGDTATARELSASYEPLPLRLLNLIFDGDSLTLGSGIPAALNISAQVSDGVVGAAVSNFGVHGQSVAAMDADAATQVDPAYIDGRLNIVAAWGGTNDLVDGATAQQVYDRLVAYHTGRRAHGFLTVAVTVIPRGPDAGAGFEAKRTALNTLIRNGWQGWADALADTDIDTVLGNTNVVNDPYYCYDTIHLTPAGVARVAALVRVALNGFGVKSAQTRATLARANDTIIIPSITLRPGTGDTPPTAPTDTGPHYWNFSDANTSWLLAQVAIPLEWKVWQLWLVAGTEGVGTVAWQGSWRPVQIGVDFTSGGSGGAVITPTTTASRTPTRFRFGNLQTPSPATHTWSYAVRRNGAVSEDGLAAPAYLFGFELVREA